ncbi:unnamed protein product [Camellia sinensis]
MHHGGTFMCNPDRLYVVGGRNIVKYFDYCKDDYMSMLYIEDLVEKLDRIGSMPYYYRMPDKDLTSGLVNVRNDNEVMGMLKFLNRNRQIDFYLEHYPKTQPSSILIDDIDELFGGQDEFHRYMYVVEAQFQKNGGGEAELEQGKGVAEVNDLFDSGYDEGSQTESTDLEDYEDSEIDESEDDMLFETHVDRNVEWGGLMRNNVTDEAGVALTNNQAQVEERWEDESALDELRSIDSSTEGEVNGKKKERYPQFNMYTDMVEPQFRFGMLFGTSKIFKDAVRQHAIKNEKSVKFVKNDSLRVRATCKPPCKWVLFAFKVQRGNSFQIKTYHPTHNCGRVFHNRQVNSTWLSKYMEALKTNPTWPLSSFQQAVQVDHKVGLSESTL